MKQLQNNISENIKPINYWNSFACCSSSHTGFYFGSKLGSATCAVYTAGMWLEVSVANF